MRHVLSIDAGHGITGPMLLAGLLDLGAPAPLVRQDVELLGAGDVRMSWVRVQRAGSPALVVSVRAPQDTPELRTPVDVQRHLADIALPPTTTALAAGIMSHLHDAVARVSGRAPDTLALGAVRVLDDLALAVGIASAVVRTGVSDTVLLGRVPVGADAVVQDLLDALPTSAADARGPTDRFGAACLAALGATPDGARGNPLAVGRGCATGADHPEVLRLLLHATDEDLLP